jgi:hypothetical protein
VVTFPERLDAAENGEQFAAVIMEMLSALQAMEDEEA